MPRQAPVARTSITLPPGDLSLADRIAAQLDRSRSWVFAEAVRRWGGAGAGPATPPQASPPEPPGNPTPALPRAGDPAAALKLSPTARLQRAQDLTAAFRRAHPRAERVQIIGFATLEDFLQWKGPA